MIFPSLRPGAERKIDVNTHGYYAVLTLIFLFSLWLRTAFPIHAIGNAGHDDLLFVEKAARIIDGDWLGDYNQLTHAKGAAYSFFLFINHWTGLPVKISEHMIYLFAALFFAVIAGRVFETKWAALVMFILLAFIPTAWSPGVGGRMVRENLYVSLSLLLLGIAIRCFVVGKAVSISEEVREKRLPLVMLGLVAGAYWLTREEGVWLLPSVMILCAYWILSRRRMLRPWQKTMFFLALPLISALIIIGAVNSVNYFKYGVFRNNDFRSSDFQAGYGALVRIKHDQWQRYVPFPKDARERAYRFSPAARELQPYFEGAIGAFWRDITGRNEILSGWFMWALRDAVSAAGHYRNAEEASSFYLRLAAEIDNACNQHPGECLPYRQTLVPPWRGHYFTDTLYASWNVFRTLITLGGAPVGVGSSSGSAERLAFFRLVTNGPLAPPASSTNDNRKTDPSWASPRDRFQYDVANILANAEKMISEFGVPAAIVTWMVWLIMAAYRRRFDAGLVIATALVAAVGTRVILLGFLDATSIFSNNMLYLSPVVPMALALVPTVLFGIISHTKKKK